MRISFVHDWEPDAEQELTWKDGLAAAINFLGTKHEVRLFTDIKYPLQHPYFLIEPISELKREWPDVILHWADMTRPHAREHKSWDIPMAICFAGGRPSAENYKLFDHIFVESKVYLEEFQKLDQSVSVAFGTNTELFSPIEEQPKLFDTIFPGTFAGWKRHNIYAEAVQGMRALACGYMYHDHEQECWQDPQKRGVMVMPHVSADVLHYLYASSKCCVVTSNTQGGSQRTVLEAMSMNLPLVITDSDKFDYVRPSGICFEAQPTPESVRQVISMAMHTKVETRQYVLDNWSEYIYAEKLEEGLKRICA